MLYANDFRRLQYPYGNVSYYVSYSNRGFVLSADRFEAEAEGMLYCTTSFDFAKFNNKYNSSTGFTDNDHPVSNQPVTMPDRKSFTGE